MAEKTHKLYGRISNGVLSLTKKSGEIINRLPDGYCKLELRLDSSPSSDQMSYYWGVVVADILAAYREMGETHTKDKIHNALKKQYIGLDEETGKEPSTGDFTRTEMAEYMTMIQADLDTGLIFEKLGL